MLLALGMMAALTPWSARSPQAVTAGLEVQAPDMASPAAEAPPSKPDGLRDDDHPYCESSGSIVCVWNNKCGCCLCNGTRLTGAVSSDEVLSVQDITLPSGETFSAP